MKVRATTALAGNGFSMKPGEIIEMSEEAAERFIAAGAGVAAEDKGTNPTEEVVRKIPNRVDVKTEMKAEEKARKAEEKSAAAAGQGPAKSTGIISAIKTLTGRKLPIL